ncbi:hypothetical protein Ddye_024078 [Dipteronia dyeriana]|uniref:Reverse transcriptase domain-containing protein n=1 Tax=Dipteronia dyeriana TaxID=168575 RepID=A0AAD9WU34_9ROSI|nr:hypothetical protein Ddye_024078 [Dipteronia dyeriana]
MAFVNGRQITNSFVITEEIISKWKSEKEGDIVIKLDFEKAYDNVDLGFLDDALTCIGFGAKWRGWIRECVYTTLMSVLVNGSPTAQFGFNRGLRQGDPLSPFLFNIVVEGLGYILQKTTYMDLFLGENFGGNRILVSHLQFMDDTIIFVKPNVESIHNVKQILRCFELVSGLKVNFGKSYVVQVGKKVDQETIGLRFFPINYLGFPLGARPNSKAFWSPVVERILHRLTHWKRKYGLDGRDLLWKGSGLASASFFAKVVASLFKQGSRSETILKEGMSAVVGDGFKIRLWEVTCSDSITLRESFPRIFALSKVKDGVLSDFGDWVGSSLSWNIPLQRYVFGWEHQQWCCFCSFIQNIKVCPNFMDVLAWSFNPNGSFTVESFRKAWEERIGANLGLVSFCWQGISPPKLEIFVWQLLKGRVMVSQVLHWFGVTINSNSMCLPCNDDKESINHLFLHCRWVSVLSRTGMGWWGVQACAFKSMEEWAEV